MVGMIYINNIIYTGVAIYESTTRAWRTFNVPHPSQLEKLEMRFDNGIVSKDLLYCQARNYNTSMGYYSKIGLMVYDMQDKEWQDCFFTISSNYQDYQFSQVVQCGVGMYMVFVQTSVFNNREFFKSIEVFKFNRVISFVLLSNEYSKIKEVKNAWRHVTSVDIQNLSIACDDCITTSNIVCIRHRTQIYFSIGIHYIVYNVEFGRWSRLSQSL